MIPPKNFGLFLLAIYLICIGAMSLLHISLGLLSFIVPILALVAGICLLIGK